MTNETERLKELIQAAEEQTAAVSTKAKEEKAALDDTNKMLLTGKAALLEKYGQLETAQVEASQKIEELEKEKVCLQGRFDSLSVLA